jgi:REP element-mobilizing transposase RayT
MRGADETRHHRRSIRLPGYDYAQAGAYLTVCTRGRECVFATVKDERMCLNEWGEVVALTWQGLPDWFRNVTLDAFVVMPNHVHGIVVIRDGGTGRGEAADKERQAERDETRSAASPLRKRPHGTEAGGLGAIIQTFKSLSSRRVNTVQHTPGAILWQRNFYERVLRDERELNAVRRYAADNPAQWALDMENPSRRVQPWSAA